MDDDFETSVVVMPNAVLTVFGQLGIATDLQHRIIGVALVSGKSMMLGDSEAVRNYNPKPRGAPVQQLVPIDPTHGTPKRFYECKCEVCRTANKAHARTNVGIR